MTPYFHFAIDLSLVDHILFAYIFILAVKMSRKYVNKGVRQVVDAEALSKAINEVMAKTMTVRNASRAYNISYSSLQRHAANAIKEEEAKSATSEETQTQLERKITDRVLGGKTVCKFIFFIVLYFGN